MIYSGVTSLLLILFVVTLLQACSSGSAATPSPSSSAAAPTPQGAPSPGSSAAASAATSAAASAATSPAASGRKTYTAPPPMTINTNQHYTATIDTEKGTIVMDLDPALAPQTVNNFVFLAKDGFYDGLLWHRVVPDFVVQGGDPQGTGAGGPGYKFNDELPPKGQYTAGCVAMANSGPNTNGSQFFICTADDTLKLSPLYNLFGYVKSGLDVAQKIAVGDHMRKVTIS
jgi:cyclophilin family peptidyl-prolyl cis-trans isomerase